MERITFDQLPEMVALILERLERIENLLTSGEGSQSNYGKEMLTTDEAAEFMGASKSFIYKLTSSNTIPVYKPTGGRVFFKRSDLMDFLQQNRIMSQSEIEQEAINYIVNGPTRKRRAERIVKK